MKTLGISPKAVLAFFLPLIGSVVITVATWISDGGTLDWSQVRIAVAGLLLSGLALLGAYVGKPGNVVIDVPANDQELGGGPLSGSPIAPDPQ